MHRSHTPTARPSHPASSRLSSRSGEDHGFASLSSEHRSISEQHDQHNRPKYVRRERGSHVGAEPGVNPRSGAAIAEYSHFKEECIIDVIDYDDQEVTFTRMGNAQFIQSVSESEGGKAQPDAYKGSESDLPPLAVRWINIGGIDWNVLSSIALRYNLDSLALEDILHESGHNHSKADYYPNHLFLRILCHSLEFLDTPGGRPESDRLNGVSHNDTYSVAEEGDSHPEDMLSHPLSDRLDGSSMPSASMAAPPSFSDLQILTKAEPEVHFPSEIQSDSKDEVGSFVSLPQDNHSRPFSGLKDSIRKRWSSLSGYYSPRRREQIVSLRALKKDHRVDIRKEPIFIFLLRNGTVISIHPTANLEYTAPINNRLRQPDSVLRTSDDASLLVESLIDLVVDRILEVMDEYQVTIGDLEHAILIEPSMNNVRSLHILSGDLIMHKRTLDPIKTMIFGLRKYDLDRSIALHDNLAMAKKEQQMREQKREHAKNRKKGKRQPTHSKGQNGGSTQVLGHWMQNLTPTVPTSQDHIDQPPLLRSDDQRLRAMGGQPPIDVQGWFSYKSKVYMADVYDHMDFALSSLDMFAAITENLLNYAFNTASYEMNIVMSRLTLVTIIFLPLTLLTGYFGMNFQPFWSVENNSDLLFWKIAIPIMATLIPLFMISDIKQKYRSWIRRRQNHLAIKELRNDPSAFRADKFLTLQP